MKNKLLFILIIIILSVPAVWFLALHGMIQTDDGNWMIIRFSAFYQALRDGQFPVRVLGRLNYGYGYPVANFLYPGFMYLSVPLHLVGFNFVNSIKILIGLSITASGIFTYFWLSEIFDEKSALFASIFYIYMPYHIYDVTRRGSVGEVLALAIFPFVMWQIERRNFILLAIGIAALLIAHNTLAILFILLVLCFFGIKFFTSKSKNGIIDFSTKSILFGFLISSFFWMPAVLELPYTVFSKTKVSDFSNYFADIHLIGPTTILIFIASVAVFFVNKKLQKNNEQVVLMIAIGILSVFLSISQSQPLWGILPVSFIQFPFRFLSLTICCASFLLAFVLSQIPEKYRLMVGIVVILLTVFFSKDLLMPAGINSADDSFYSTNEATTTVMDEYMPLWVKQKPTEHFKNEVNVQTGEGEVSNVFYNSNKITFNYSSDTPSVVRVSTIYYPGWEAFSNGLEKAIFYDNKNGLMELKLNSGNQFVSLNFTETPIRMFSDIVSLLAFCLWGFLLLKDVSKRFNLGKK
ncbi:MAG TPA: 6-pyruvoyl-tetrahydropterin synthase-related protein [Patescibacteria group bacterium]|nr:6-pyruvoyl-tetrahydropterin synthase-related protein [Patescibacteria group bacterium]